MCGIFGFSLKTNGNRRVALQKFKILGLYNVRRGKDATGVFVNGEIIKGIGIKSEFDDFIEREHLSIPKENGIMLGHTRQGSWGYKKTIDEAHPFLINEDLVFTHNGTIKNVKELCEKYGVIESEFTVDSQMLGTILLENGSQILEDYIGAAALAYTKLSEPNVLYLYHGASKEFKHGNITEERPLYYLETRDGIFYSSLEESLQAIIDDEKEQVHNMEYNHVYRIENGKFMLEQSVKIEREEMNVSVYVPTIYPGKYSQAPTRTYGNATINKRFSGGGASTNDENLIKRETLPINLVKAVEKKNLIYYHYGRYWDAPRTLLDGPIYLKKGGLYGSFDDNASELVFFWKGVWLKNKDCFEEIKRLNEAMGIKNWVKNPSDYNYAMMLSKYSKYPITNINTEAMNAGNYFRSQWYCNGESCKSDNFTPKYANGRNYKIEDGYLIKLSASQREKTLHATIELAWEEIGLLMKGYLLPGILGGDSHPAPFLLTNRSATITEQKEENELVWFFDISPLTEQDCIDFVGEPEIEALNRFCSYIFKQDWNLTLLPPEMEEKVKEMLDDAIERKCSILDLIETDMDKQRLITYYEFITKSNMRQAMQSELPFKEDDDIYVEPRDEDTVYETFDDMTKEEIFEKIESGINCLEDTQQAFAELVDAQDSELAQECAKEGMIGVSNTLANLEGVLSKYKETDLINRIKRIRENKRQKDGVL